MPKLPSSKEIIRTLKKHGLSLFHSAEVTQNIAVVSALSLSRRHAKKFHWEPSALSFANLASMPEISKNRATAPTRYTF